MNTMRSFIEGREGKEGREGAYAAEGWSTDVISTTCQVVTGSTMDWTTGKPRYLFCGGTTAAAYPAMGGGWMALCDGHAEKHRPHGCMELDFLLERGEVVGGAV